MSVARVEISLRLLNVMMHTMMRSRERELTEVVTGKAYST